MLFKLFSAIAAQLIVAGLVSAVIGYATVLLLTKVGIFTARTPGIAVELTYFLSATASFGALLMMLDVWRPRLLRPSNSSRVDGSPHTEISPLPLPHSANRPGSASE